MAKDDSERRIHVLPKELLDRVRAFQSDQGIASEVEAVRRLLDSALQARDDVYSLLIKLRQAFKSERDLRILAKEILISHTLVTSVSFEDGELVFRVGTEDRGKIDRQGRTFFDTDPTSHIAEWRETPPPAPAPEKSGDMDDEIPF